MTDYWSPRTPTKTGRIDPPPTKINRFGESSTASRRYQERVYDRRILAGIVQLAPGMLVVWDRAPWRVIEIREFPIDLWPAKYETAFTQDVARWEQRLHGDRPEKPTWNGRPINIALTPDRKPRAKPLVLTTPAHHGWDVLPEHYAICVACGQMPPCRHELAEREADDQMARTEVLMSIPPGHCLGCGEPITSRQKAARFPGPNLWRPDLPDGSAVFHARKDCASKTSYYRRQWETAGGEDPQLSISDTPETTAP